MQSIKDRILSFFHIKKHTQTNVKTEDVRQITPDYTKPSANRKFVIGDVVLYDEVGQQYGTSGWIDFNLEPYTRTGIMLIGGFDYDSDTACRCSIGRSAIGYHPNTVYGNFAPSGRNYRYAKKHHIKKFIRRIENDNILRNIYFSELCLLQEKVNNM